ncbi:hypothetical protein EOA30_12230 [Mesorhizobium sp. M8A.F.Ca.ET.059.01.1.1]|nr:hypothetical protein EOA30_12230 [Mesorhizobium sp. M8A.F.Ca.ET.059.01.1.1]
MRHGILKSFDGRLLSPVFALTQHEVVADLNVVAPLRAGPDEVFRILAHRKAQGGAVIQHGNKIMAIASDLLGLLPAEPKEAAKVILKRLEIKETQGMIGKPEVPVAGRLQKVCTRVVGFGQKVDAVSIIKPFISPHCEHYRATRVLHQVLLNTVREVTGKEVPFIQRNGTGPSRPPTAG